MTRRSETRLAVKQQWRAGPSVGRIVEAVIGGFLGGCIAIAWARVIGELAR